jgi:SAM-dependent methyltransferase
MTERAGGKALLENAYRLESPEDNVAYYRDFAAFYDSDFVAALGYQYPARVAEIYRRLAGPEDGPIADAGCGTGLVAAALAPLDVAIDGFDISAEMLERAAARGIYRALEAVDLTGPLDAVAGVYGAVLSAGTFTHGHLGPEPLRGLVKIARVGGLFVIGVNRAHFVAQGFGAVLEDMVATGQIVGLRTDEVKIYARPGHEHSEDRALVLSFRRG